MREQQPPPFVCVTSRTALALEPVSKLIGYQSVSGQASGISASPVADDAWREATLCVRALLSQI